MKYQHRGELILLETDWGYSPRAPQIRSLSLMYHLLNVCKFSIIVYSLSAFVSILKSLYFSFYRRLCISLCTLVREAWAQSIQCNFNSSFDLCRMKREIKFHLEVLQEIWQSHTWTNKGRGKSKEQTSKERRQRGMGTKIKPCTTPAVHPDLKSHSVSIKF